MEWIARPEAWVGLLTLTALEVVLGIDNVIFISILAGKLPRNQQKLARRLGLAVAMITRIALLFSLAWIMRLTAPLFHLFAHAVSGRDLILIAGGLFLLAKSTHEIHQKLEGGEGEKSAKVYSFSGVIVQIMLLDIVFSLDSVITAVGMIRELGIMVTAIVIAVLIMMFFAEGISSFVDRHPTVKMLALSFLLMIGLLLVADGLGHHIPKGYAYFAMGFSVFVEMLNLRVRAKAKPVQLHDSFRAPEPQRTA
jgi:predicted tellurium resistance membrane protein TerC